MFAGAECCAKTFVAGPRERPTFGGWVPNAFSKFKVFVLPDARPVPRVSLAATAQMESQQ